MRSNNYDISTESILDYSGIHGYDFINLLIRQPLKIIKSPVFICGIASSIHTSFVTINENI